MALRIVIGDVTIGIHGQDFSYIFSVGSGGMESLYKDGKEWLYKVSPTRLSGARSRTMTEGVDSHSAVRYGPRRIVLYAAAG